MFENGCSGVYKAVGPDLGSLGVQKGVMVSRGDGQYFRKLEEKGVLPRGKGCLGKWNCHFSLLLPRLTATWFSNECPHGNHWLASLCDSN